MDCSGLYLTPGLVDCHSHITATPGSATIASMMESPRDAIILRSAHVLNGMLARGFTTVSLPSYPIYKILHSRVPDGVEQVRDVGGASKAHADATAEWLIAGPRIFQGGPVMSQTGGHGDASDPNGTPGTGCCSGGSGGGMGRVVDGVDECLRYARDAMRFVSSFDTLLCFKFYTNGLSLPDNPGREPITSRSVLPAASVPLRTSSKVIFSSTRWTRLFREDDELSLDLFCSKILRYPVHRRRAPRVRSALSLHVQPARS